MTLTMEISKPNNGRQGDRLLKGFDVKTGTKTKLPEDIQTMSGNILVRSVVTGHTHRFVGNVKLYRLKNSKTPDEPDYIEVLSPTAQLVHDEHPTITILKGIYLVIKEVEFDPWLRVMRQVFD